MIHLTPYLFLTLITFVWTVHSKEYYIKDRAIPSYLHWQQHNSSKDKFLKDINVNVSMSRVQGTFVYSFDRNMNQLIVTMRDGLPHVMDIELNTQRISVSLPSICGCDRCRYEALELRIQIGSNIRVQCNDGHIKMFKNEYRIGINEHYPILLKTKKRSTQVNSSVWLVNTPQYDRVYPNMYQMYGCIFDVSFYQESIQFTEVTPNIDNKCIKTCTDNICNGGQCYETYNSVPICNCTSTFRNGPYCNDSIAQINIRTNDIYIQTESFKLSWNSSVDELFELKNAHMRILLGVEQSTLFLEYKTEYTRRRIYSKVELSNKYAPNKDYICIIHFQRRTINIQLLNDGHWTTEIMSTNQDLSREVFKEMILRSGDGIIDLVYKDNEEYQWRQLHIYNYYIPNEDTSTPPRSFPTTTTENTTKSTTLQSKTIIWIMSIGMGLSIVVAAIAIIFVYRRKLKSLRSILRFKGKSKEESDNQIKVSPVRSHISVKTNETDLSTDVPQIIKNDDDNVDQKLMET